MLVWWHEYFPSQNNIYLFWVDVDLAAWIFCPPKWHLLVLQVEQVDAIFVGKDIAIVFWFKMRCIEFLCNPKFGKSNLGIGIPIWWILNSRIQKKNPTGISGIGNRIGIPLPVGVPEIGTKNWNSQPSPSQKSCTCTNALHLDLQGTGKGAWSFTAWPLAQSSSSVLSHQCPYRMGWLNKLTQLGSKRNMVISLSCLTGWSIHKSGQASSQKTTLNFKAY